MLRASIKNEGAVRRSRIHFSLLEAILVGRYWQSDECMIFFVEIHLGGIPGIQEEFQGQHIYVKYFSAEKKNKKYDAPGIPFCLRHTGKYRFIVLSSGKKVLMDNYILKRETIVRNCPANSDSSPALVFT